MLYSIVQPRLFGPIQYSVAEYGDEHIADEKYDLFIALLG